MKGVVPKVSDKTNATAMKCSRYSSPTKASDIRAKITRLSPHAADTPNRDIKWDPNGPKFLGASPQTPI